MENLPSAEKACGILGDHSQFFGEDTRAVEQFNKRRLLRGPSQARKPMCDSFVYTIIQAEISKLDTGGGSLADGKPKPNSPIETDDAELLDQDLLTCRGIE